MCRWQYNAWNSGGCTRGTPELCPPCPPYCHATVQTAEKDWHDIVRPSSCNALANATFLVWFTFMSYYHAHLNPVFGRLILKILLTSIMKNLGYFIGYKHILKDLARWGYWDSALQPLRGWLARLVQTANLLRFRWAANMGVIRVIMWSVGVTAVG